MLDKSPRIVINVAIYLDEQYAPHAAVLIRSLLENANPNYIVQLFVLSIDLSSATKSRLESSWPRESLKINWIDLTEIVEENSFTAVGYLSKAAYLRLYIGLCLPTEIDQVITIDSDGVVLGDVAELWQKTPAQFCLTAVRDPCIPRLSDDLSPGFNSIPSNPSAAYFNSGLMVINLKRWREQQILERCIELSKRALGQPRYADQSILNVVLQGAWEPLPLAWNCSTRHLLMHAYPSLRGRFYSISDIDRALRHPKFVHFLSAAKPWKYGRFHIDQRIYNHYRAMTDWKVDYGIESQTFMLPKAVAARCSYYRQTQALRHKLGLSCAPLQDIAHFLKDLIVPTERMSFS